MTRVEAVSSAIVHSSGSVFATCSGQRHFESHQDDSSESYESDDSYHSIKVKPTAYYNHLKVWTKTKS
jgi:hypothetical protein